MKKQKRKSPKIQLVEPDQQKECVLLVDDCDIAGGANGMVMNPGISQGENAEQAAAQHRLANSSKTDSNETVFSQEVSHIADVLGLPANYEVVQTLGAGGMATVYKARDRDASHAGRGFVAIKMLRPELARDPVVVERFYREAKAAQKLDHANLVQVFSYGQTGQGIPFLVMEYVDGVDLSKVLEQEGFLSVPRMVDIALQICSVLKAAHEIGLVHRDVKPSNIILTKSETGQDIAKLVDFGIAKPKLSERLANPALTHTGSIIGSPAYMSPEQAMGDSVDERSDIYSLGCVMYELLTGRNPFAADTPVKAIVQHLEQEPESFDIEFKHLDIPIGLEEIVMKCLSKSPSERYQKVFQLQEALLNPPAPGIWRRFSAHAVDCLVLFFAFAMISMMFDIRDPVSLIVLPTVIIGLYYTLFETSRFQATPGKMLTSLKVYSSKDGGRVSAVNSAYCNMLCFLVGYVLPIYFSLECSQHIHLSSLLFGYAATFTSIWLSFFNLLPTMYNHGRKDLVDMISGRITARPYHDTRESKSKSKR